MGPQPPYGAAAAAFLLVHLIGFLTNLTPFHRVGWSLPPSSRIPRSALIPVVAVAGCRCCSSP